MAIAPPARPRTGQSSDAVLDRLSRLHPKIIDLSLGRIEDLLARLGHPESRLPPVVHVAGTNGKGSVIAYLHAMFEAAGSRVQAYTSPHLVRFHERIRLCRGSIDETALLALLEHCETVNGPDPITFFEVTTAAAFLAFADEPADILLLETGLGGRLDATNVLARPRLSVITPVSIDHEQYLGSDLAGIAAEKAGILKSGVPAVIGPQPPAALAAIEQRAAEVGAQLYVFGRDWHAEAADSGMIFRGRGAERALPVPALHGAHQVDNAGIALACAEVLDEFALDPPVQNAGLVRARWPGRLQRLREGPLPALLPGGWELWLDGGHNAAAGAALGHVAADWNDRPLHLICGMLNTKAAENFLRPLAPHLASVHTVAIPGEPASLSADEVAAHVRAAGISAITSDSVHEAVEDVRCTDAPGRILICGSLYLAGQVLAENR
ncbi:MAG: bifunctional folylpolyglutamate synthase/dihydrofolate synthase [Alphaproteobacteria bacterium]